MDRLRFDNKDILFVRIDRRRKLPRPSSLRALGYSTEELLNYFYRRETMRFDKRPRPGPRRPLRSPQDSASTADVSDKDGNVVCRAGKVPEAVIEDEEGRCLGGVTRDRGR